MFGPETQTEDFLQSVTKNCETLISRGRVSRPDEEFKTLCNKIGNREPSGVFQTIRELSGDVKLDSDWLTKSKCFFVPDSDWLTRRFRLLD